MKRALACSLLAVLALACGCGKSPSTSTTANDDSSATPTSHSDRSTIAWIDKEGDEIMAGSAKVEAREWMKGPKHVFFKADPKVVAQFVEDFYQAGAVQVYIADIETEQGNDYGESLLVVLPTDPNLRAKLFEIEARVDTTFDNDPVPDKGQKYLYNGLE